MRFRGFSAWLADPDRAPAERDFAAIALIMFRSLARRLDRNASPPNAVESLAFSAAASELPAEGLAVALGVLARDLTDSPVAATPGLIGFGKAAEDAGAYDLGSDVYHFAADLGRCEPNIALVPHALHRAGFCLRNQDRIAEAEAAYRAGILAAQEFGDEVSELLIEGGLAKIAIHQDHYTAACQQLDSIIDRARAAQRLAPLAFALQDRALVATHQGNHQQALTYLQEALSLQSDPARQLRIVNDIGNAARAGGMSKVARSAFETVRTEATQADLRWSATINLLDMHAEENAWAEFDRLLACLVGSPPTDRLECELLETLAGAHAKRGQKAQAENLYRRVAEIAQLRGFTEILRRVRRALRK